MTYSVCGSVLEVCWQCVGSMLQCVGSVLAVCWQYVAVCWQCVGSVLAVCCSVLQHFALRCSVSQCDAVCCTTLQCVGSVVAVSCSVLLSVLRGFERHATMNEISHQQIQSSLAFSQLCILRDSKSIQQAFNR